MGEATLGLKKVALALGGARCIWQDVQRASKFGAFGGIVACNDIGAQWRGPLDAWVTLHAVKMNSWAAKRRVRGLPECQFIVSNLWAPAVTAVREHIVPGLTIGATSGFFMAKVALEDLGFEKVILCGVPMDAAQGHYFNSREWRQANRFKKEWLAALPYMAGRVRSMSGWTRDILGAPNAEWLGLSDRQRLAPLIKSTDQRRVLIELVHKNGWRQGAEVGVLKGKTLFSLLEACPDLKMTGVDQWQQLTLRNVDCAETYSQFNMNHMRLKVEQKARAYGRRCKILAGDTVAMAEKVLVGSLDFVFIDADHTEAGVRRDIEAWHSKVRKGGMILGHDVSWPTVKKVIDELCPDWVDFGEEVWGIVKS